MNNLERNRQIAKTARRSASNEASLLWSFSGIVYFFVLLSYIPARLLDRVALHMEPYVFCAMIACILGGISAFIYYRIAKPVIDAAIAEDNEILKAERQRRQRETRSKMAKMKEAG